jgi:hypothetical protein
LKKLKIINLDFLIIQLLDESQKKLIKKILFSNKIIKIIKICTFCNKKDYSIDKYWKKNPNKFIFYNNKFNKIEKINIINLFNKIEKNLDKKRNLVLLLVLA